MKKKLLIYAHYYAPDVASTGQILQELAEGLLKTFDITVICVVPSYDGHIKSEYKTKKFYKEKINGVDILRIRVSEFNKENKRSRIRNIIQYFFGAIVATFKVGKQDCVFAVSQPPILGGILGTLGKWIKHARYIYNIQDFNPEQTMAVGYCKNRIMLKLMMIFDKFSCQKSSLVITVGRDLQETIKKRFNGRELPKTVVINNWIDEEKIFPLPENNERVMKFKKQYGLENKFIVMYSGNIGLYYDLENLIKVIEKFKGSRTPAYRGYPQGKEVVFVFVGEGCLKDFLMQYVVEHQMKHVVFIPYQKKEELIYSLNACDVHWCISAKGIKGVSCPSKYYGSVAVAKPIIGVLEEGSEIRLLIEETQGGLVSEPGDYETIEENLRWFINHAGEKSLYEMGKKGYDNLVQNLSKERSIKKYETEILKAVI